MNDKSTSNTSKTDWEKLHRMTDEDIDFSDCPEATPEMFARAIVRKGLPATNTNPELIIQKEKE